MSKWTTPTIVALNKGTVSSGGTGTSYIEIVSSCVNGSIVTVDYVGVVETSLLDDFTTDTFTVCS